MIPKKAQAAIEFLMTYGWAVLVVIAAIAALAYFGVMNPGRNLPEKCSFPSGISCVGFGYNNGNIEMMIINNMAYTMMNTSISVEGCQASSQVAERIKNNEEYKFLVPCDLSGQDKIDKKTSITFTNKESELTHTKEGQLQMRIIE